MCCFQADCCQLSSLGGRFCSFAFLFPGVLVWLLALFAFFLSGCLLRSALFLTGWCRFWFLCSESRSHPSFSLVTHVLVSCVCVCVCSFVFVFYLSDCLHRLSAFHFLFLVVGAFLEVFVVLGELLCVCVCVCVCVC